MKKDIILIPNYETGVTEEYKVGSFDKNESKREAQKMYELLVEKERVLTQLEILKEKISFVREKANATQEDEKEVEKIYKTIENSDDANFELALYCFENNKPIKGIEYLKKSLNISKKHEDFVINYVDKYLISDVKKGINYKNDNIQTTFIKEFKDYVIKQLETELKIVSGDEKKNLKELQKYLKSL